MMKASIQKNNETMQQLIDELRKQGKAVIVNGDAKSGGKGDAENGPKGRAERGTVGGEGQLGYLTGTVGYSKHSGSIFDH